jgi:hypothetical protein
LNETTENRQNPLLRRLILLITLIVLLIGVNLLYQPAVAWNTVQTGEAGDLLYAAGFDGFEDEWQQYDGRLFSQIDNGVLRMGLEVNDTIYSASSPLYADFDVRVTVKGTEGVLENDGYGIIFRLSDSGDEETSCLRRFVIVCNFEQIGLLRGIIRLLAPQPTLEQSGYLFLISNDGYYSLWKLENGTYEQVTIWHYSNGVLNEGLNVENHIRVVGRGDEFEFYLNGQAALLCIPLEGELPTGNSDNCLGEESYIWKDDSFAQGKLGLVVSGATNPDTVAEFDNFTVFMPQEVESIQT